MEKRKEEGCERPKGYAGGREQKRQGEQSTMGYPGRVAGP
jgi:hypothetical protein